jgi:hypothetical protein
MSEVGNLKVWWIPQVPGEDVQPVPRAVLPRQVAARPACTAEEDLMVEEGKGR